MDQSNGRIIKNSSCAECKRLKLKCSRQWPCTTCIKRGCAHVCPTGETRIIKGKRVVSAETEALNDRIAELEKALAHAHARHSLDTHPLLLHSYHKFDVKPQVQALDLQRGEAQIEQAFGTLTMGRDGQARFIGGLAGSEYLQDGDEKPNRGRPVFSEASGLATPPETAGLHVSPRFDGIDDLWEPALGLVAPGRGGTNTGPRTVLGRLPSWDDEGSILVANYRDNVDWMHHPIPRVTFEQDYLTVYDAKYPPNANKLACVFIVMGLGALFDLDGSHSKFHPRKGSASDPDLLDQHRAQELYRNGVACLQAEGASQPSLASVQALLLCATFLLNTDDTSAPETAWLILGTAVKMAQRLGLHRDGDVFGLSPKETAERRRVWWELMMQDRLQALCFGRPCTSSNKSCDTMFPSSHDHLTTEKHAFHGQMYRLARMTEQVIDLQTQNDAASVEQILRIDQNIQDFTDSMPECLMAGVATGSLPLDHEVHPHLVLQRLTIRLLVAHVRVLLNRSAFAQALRNNPDDPSTGRSGKSFVSLFENALEIINSLNALIIYHPSLVTRWWFYWNHCASACVCLAAVAIRAPNCPFASPAYHALTRAVGICQALKDGTRAKRVLPPLIRLQERASDALHGQTQDATGLRGTNGSHSPDEDLAHLTSIARLRRLDEQAQKSQDSPEGDYLLSQTKQTGRSSESDLSPSLEGADHSPLSVGSMATSDTMVDFMTTTDIGTGGIIVMPSRGAVPPPPPELQSAAGALENADGQVGAPAITSARIRKSLKRLRRTTVSSLETCEESNDSGQALSVSRGFEHQPDHYGTSGSTSHGHVDLNTDRTRGQRPVNPAQPHADLTRPTELWTALSDIVSSSTSTSTNAVQNTGHGHPAEAAYHYLLVQAGQMPYTPTPTQYPNHYTASLLFSNTPWGGAGSTTAREQPANTMNVYPSACTGSVPILDEMPEDFDFELYVNQLADGCILAGSE
ncbi:fungal-specific transcription factor domain-domain-containing protein [Kockovaella imperatae]|uniref:Fungal-specific transcription factor domain-domain-containing protein n=1 Tax=Kockovaella imperatae TaxID=4999 RepID=A0A1Y1U7R8_9TREE|nr:fungal-specific transcription factor domain-domain-containing protein [Kockovaella imperatae]ORX34053.1 fungal-specific transcription factor domain-domain-containing protein [Kockovaella imperatae]